MIYQSVLLRTTQIFQKTFTEKVLQKILLQSVRHLYLQNIFLLKTIKTLIGPISNKYHQAQTQIL